MDKRQFIKRAPEYYALGLAVVLKETEGKAQTLEDLSKQVANVLSFEPLALAGMKILADAGVVEVIPDDFAPTTYVASEELADWMEEGGNSSLFVKFERTGNSRVWLLAALRSVNDEYLKLEITRDDFDPAIEDKEWEPIPLDRSDEKLKVAITKIDEAIQVIEGDNGYAANVPGEREYVVSSLKLISGQLKVETQIYWMYVKNFALDPLVTVAKRFGKAATGLAAAIARAAIIDWLKDVLKDNFHRLF